MKIALTLISLILFITVSYALTIYDIQYTENANGTSPYEGQTVTVSGVVTRIYGTSVCIQDTAIGPEWSGILLYNIGSGFNKGDYITVTGIVDEYYDKTEITNISNYTINSTGNELPEPALLQTNEIAQEKYEGVLVMVKDARVITTQDSYGDWQIDDGSGACYVTEDNYAPYSYTPAIGDTLLFIKGVIDYDYGDYKILPSGNEDILKSINGSGEASVNPKYSQTNTFINAKLNIYTLIDTSYGLIDFIRIRFNADTLIDTITFTSNRDSLTVNKDILSNTITIDIFNAQLTDTVFLNIYNMYFINDISFTVYTGEDQSYFQPINSTPEIKQLPDMEIMDIAEVQRTNDGYNSIYNNQTVTIRGIVIGTPDIFTPTTSSTSFYVQDATGGINIYSSSDPMNYTYKLGNELIITGTVTEYNGVTEVKYASPDTNILVINDSTYSPEPTLLNNSQGISELNEGRLLKAEYCKIATAPVSAGTGKNFQVYNGQTLIDVRITDKSPLYTSDKMSEILPGRIVNITGIGGQYDTEEPYTAGYQLLIRYIEDVEFLSTEQDSVFTVKILPNPVSFDRGESVRFEIGAMNNEYITVKIYDMAGRHIKTIAENVPGPGLFVWDGRDYLGRPVNIGAYIVTIDKIDINGNIKRKMKSLIISTNL